MGAWIETFVLAPVSLRSASHPTWVRGLKRDAELYLKRARVAPYVGAWIETEARCQYPTDPASRTLRGCVD